MIEIRNLSFSYGGKGPKILSSVDLFYRGAEIDTILGPNGSGKTTLLKIIAGIIRNYRGVVKLKGYPLEKLRPRERARLIAYVPQETMIPFDFSVYDVVLMGRTLNTGHFGFESRKDREIVVESLSFFGMEKFISKRISEISGGERKMVFIARAIAQEALALLLDEPTAFLDLRHRLNLFGVLEYLKKKRGVLSLLTTHDLTNLPSSLDNVTILKGDGTAISGAPADILRREVIEGVFGVKIGMVRTGERQILFPSELLHE